jgi:acyl-CoA dehydrogenase
MLRGVVRLRSAESLAPFLERAHVERADTLRRFCASELDGRPEPASDADARVAARSLLRRMGDQRLYDAIGRADLRGLCLARELVAAADPLADAVLALQALGGTPFVLAGSDAQRRRWLDPLLSGELMAAFAMTEPEAGSDVAAMRTSATHDGDGWILEGEKHLISNAGIADLYLVFAVTSPGRGSRGISMFAVPAATPGLRFEGAQVLAAPHPLGRIRLSGCRVPADAVVGTIDGGFKLGMQTLDFVRPSVGAAACGMAARALEEALTHTSTRQQFGQPLSALQLVREKLGQMMTELEAARLLVFAAAWRRDRGAERITLEAAMAKSYATEAAQRIIDGAVQLSGGRGVLVGNPVERLYRAVRALRIYEGATEIQHLIIAGALLEPV